MHGGSAAAGCSSTSGYVAGASWSVDLGYDGGTYTHNIGLPSNYNASTPTPLVMFFHGWGGSANSCGNFCTELTSNGIMYASMTGMGGPDDSNSWAGSGSINSPGPDGAICENAAGAPRLNDYCYKDCGSSCTDSCWWTTCTDSVGQVVDMLDYLERLFCVDASAVWVAGSSNGGMFTFELADDSRMAGRIAGIVPSIGLPHNGFNNGPLLTSIHMFGFWGLNDNAVPPLSNTDDPTKSQDNTAEHWYYSTARNTTDLWAARARCSPRVNYTSYGIANRANLACTTTPDCESGAVLVEWCVDRDLILSLINYDDDDTRERTTSIGDI